MTIFQIFGSVGSPLDTASPRGAFLTPFRVWYRGPNWQLWAYCGLGVPKWPCAGCLQVTGISGLSFPI